MAVSFMKKGADSAAAVKAEDAKIEAKKAAAGGTFRFYLKPGEENVSITFVDGNLTKEGVLDILTYREHSVFMDGKWGNHFVCTEDAGEPCPICEGTPGSKGDQSSLVGILTVIDHRSFPSSKEPGKVFKDQPRLFVAKRDTIKTLQAMATKRGGLAGCRFDVMRSGEKSPAVGTQFDFTEKETDLKKLKAKYTRTDAEGKVHTTFVPLDYSKEIIYRPAAELRAMGFGKGGAGVVGAEKPPADNQDYSQHM